MKRVAISVCSTLFLVSALSSIASAQFQLKPVLPVPAPQLPGIKTPAPLPVPIERPAWPRIRIYVGPALTPALPSLPASPAALPLSALRPAGEARVLPVQPLTAPQSRPTARKTEDPLAAVRRAAVSGGVRDARQALGMGRAGSRPSAKRLQIVFDGLQKAQAADAVDTRPSLEIEGDDEVEGGPVEQPLPWLEPSRSVNLPEWDLEREIGLR